MCLSNLSRGPKPGFRELMELEGNNSKLRDSVKWSRTRSNSKVPWIFFFFPGAERWLSWGFLESAMVPVIWYCCHYFSHHHSYLPASSLASSFSASPKGVPSACPHPSASRCPVPPLAVIPRIQNLLLYSHHPLGDAALSLADLAVLCHLPLCSFASWDPQESSMPLCLPGSSTDSFKHLALIPQDLAGCRLHRVLAVLPAQGER